MCHDSFICSRWDRSNLAQYWHKKLYVRYASFICVLPHPYVLTLIHVCASVCADTPPYVPTLMHISVMTLSYVVNETDPTETGIHQQDSTITRSSMCESTRSYDSCLLHMCHNSSMCHDSSICGTDQTLQETTTTRRSPLRESRAHYIRSLDLCLCYQVSLSVLSVSFSVSWGLFVCVYPELWLGVSHCCLWMVVSSRKRVPARYVCLLLSLLVYLVSRCCLSMGVSCLNGSLVSQCESLLASGLIMCVSCFFYLCLLLSLVCSVYSLKTTARRARPYFSRHFSWRHPSCAPLVLHIDLSTCEVSMLLRVAVCCNVLHCGAVCCICPSAAHTSK